jgi:hypothetical protein
MHETRMTADDDVSKAAEADYGESAPKASPWARATLISLRLARSNCAIAAWP